MHFPCKPAPNLMQIYLNGNLTDAAEATVSVFDLGFTMGVSVTEQIRTYGKSTPLLARHLDRFFGGLEIIGLAPPFDRSQLETQIADLIAINGQSLTLDDELGIGICATPGIASSFGQTNVGPTLLIYTYPLYHDDLTKACQTGVRLTTVKTQEIPAASIPKELKCRSRMHYYLAEQEAQAIDPNSRALLTNTDGFVAEATTASVVMIQSGRLIAPLKETVLPGVSLGVAIEIAQQIGLTVERRNIRTEELEKAQEVIWLTTPNGIIPATHINQRPIGTGNVGEITEKLIYHWTNLFSV